MQAHSNDRVVPAHKRSKAPQILFVVVLLAFVGAGYNFWQKSELFGKLPVTLIPPAATPAIPPADKPAAAVALPAAVVGPVTTPEQVTASEPALSPAVEEAPLPLLDESDNTIKTAVSDMVGASLREPLATHWLGDNLLRRFVAFVANLAEGKLDSKSSPFTPPKARFAVTASKPLIMTTESQGRFNTHVQIITSIDPSVCAAAYRRYYPLLHSAYADLGEKKTFHSVMLAAIDKVLATPDLLSEPELVPAEKGLFKFTDPTLEALPAAQKPLLRMGRKNAGDLKQWLKLVRNSLLAAPAAGAPDTTTP